jgi:hypothetical protein
VGSGHSSLSSRKGVTLLVTYEAMNMMISFATLIIAVVALGISANKKK